MHTIPESLYKENFLHIFTQYKNDRKEQKLYRQKNQQK